MFSIRLVVIYRIPPSKQNQIKQGTFIIEFSECVETSSCLGCLLIIVGDFNSYWLNVMIMSANSFIL